MDRRDYRAVSVRRGAGRGHTENSWPWEGKLKSPACAIGPQIGIYDPAADEALTPARSKQRTGKR